MGTQETDVAGLPEAHQESEGSLLFKETVDYVAESMNGSVIENHDIKDAWYLFKKIFEKAVEKRYPVTILSGKLHCGFYNSLTQQLEEALTQGCPVQVYVSEVDEPDGGEKNRFAQRLEKAINADQQRSVPLGHKLICAQVLGPVAHLICAGENGEAFRLETDHENHYAFGSFGAERAGRAVVELATRCAEVVLLQHRAVLSGVKKTYEAQGAL